MPTARGLEALGIRVPRHQDPLVGRVKRGKFNEQIDAVAIPEIEVAQHHVHSVARRRRPGKQISRRCARLDGCDGVRAPHEILEHLAPQLGIVLHEKDVVLHGQIHGLRYAVMAIRTPCLKYISVK